MSLGLFGKKKRAPSEDQTLSLYYASDVHGSDQCWRKFLGCGRFYGVDALIMGGDLTGKAIVPIAGNGSGSFTITTTFTGTNTCGAPVSVSRIALGPGPDGGAQVAFTVDNFAPPVSLVPGDELLFQVGFTPAGPGPESRTLLVTSSG